MSESEHRNLPAKAHPQRGRAVLLAFALAAGALTSLPGLAQEQEGAKKSDDLAILIVGDDQNAEMVRREQALIQEMMARTAKKTQRVHVLSYHFNKPRERTYCEKKLSILSEDLLFVGVVSLADRVPKKVLYRLDRIVSPVRSADDVLARSDELLGIPPVTPVSTPEAPTTPAVSNTTTEPSKAPAVKGAASKVSASGHWRVQLGVFSAMKNAQDVIDQLKAKGYEGKVDKADDKFKVFIGPYASKEDAQQGAAELRGDGFDKGFVVEVK